MMPYLEIPLLWAVEVVHLDNGRLQFLNLSFLDNPELETGLVLGHILQCEHHFTFALLILTHNWR